MLPSQRINAKDLDHLSGSLHCRVWIATLLLCSILCCAAWALSTVLSWGIVRYDTLHSVAGFGLLLCA